MGRKSLKALVRRHFFTSSPPTVMVRDRWKNRDYGEDARMRGCEDARMRYVRCWIQGGSRIVFYMVRDSTEGKSFPCG